VFTIGRIKHRRCCSRGSNAGGGDIFHTSPNRLWSPTSLLYNGYCVIPRGKRPERVVNHPPNLVPKLKLKIVEL